MLAFTFVSALMLGAVVPHDADAAQTSNAANAKLCRKGGWEGLVRSDGTGFTSQRDCTKYAMSGGTLLPKPLTPLQECQKDITDAGVAIPAEANYVLGTDDADQFDINDLTAAPDVLCGFDGSDEVTYLFKDDIFVGGAGNDQLTRESWDATFIGGDGEDVVAELFGGTVRGGLGNDGVGIIYWGTFYGGPGGDSVVRVDESGTFDGGDGTDFTCNAHPGATLIDVEFVNC